MNEVPNPVRHMRERLSRSQHVRWPTVSYRQVQGLSSTRFGVGLQQALLQTWEEDGSPPLPGMKC